MKRIIYAALFAAMASPVVADDSVKLVYPVDASKIELDNSSPAKRITPPVVESSEYDPVTPIGQIKTILDSLNTILDKQKTLSNDVDELKRLNAGVDLSGVFTKADGDALKTSLEETNTERKNVSDSLKKLLGNSETESKERKTIAADVRSILGGATNARSKLADNCTFVTLALVVLQTIVLCGQTIASFVRSQSAAFEEKIVKHYIEKNNGSSNKSNGGII